MTRVAHTFITRCALAIVLGALALALGASARQGVGAANASPRVQGLASGPALTDHLASDGDYDIYLPLVFANHHEPPAPTPFGAQLYGSITEERVALQLMRKGQVYWARWPVGWSSVEPVNTTPDNYRWVADTSILNAYNNGSELIVTIVSNPEWAATYANGQIDLVDLSEFAQFMAAMAERYDGDGFSDAPGSPVVNYFEMYNEPDAGLELAAASGHSYWGPFGDQYAAMLCAIYPAMKDANPDVQVALGGIAYDAFLDSQGNGAFVREFLGDVLAAGGGECFDVMNFHYYPPFEGVWSPYGPGLSGKANYLRQNYDLTGKPMIVTEAGWHSEDYSVYPSTPTLQARYVIELFTQAMNSDLMALTWWTWRDPGGGYGPNGLLTVDLEPKLAYYAFKDAVVRIGRASFEAMVDVGSPAVKAYRFRSPASVPLYVLWSDDGASHLVSIPLSRARIVNMYGVVQYSLSDADDGRTDGKISVWVGADPIYVESIE